MSAAIAELKRRGWIDKSTRAVYIEFTLYNAPANLIAPTAVLLEFPGTGGIVSSIHTFPIQLLRYHDGN